MTFNQALKKARYVWTWSDVIKAYIHTHKSVALRSFQYAKKRHPEISRKSYVLDESGDLLL